MTRILAASLALFLTLIATAIAQPFTVSETLGEWRDVSRNNRDVPYKIYAPTNAPGARPIVLFSHGLGGNREGSEYLLGYLAEHGYVVVAVQHRGSDTPAVFGELNGQNPGDMDPETLRNRLRNSTTPAVAIERFKDIPFAIDQLTLMSASDPQWKGRLDVNRIGLSGHSFGAITTLALAGQNIAGGRISFADPRLKAAIAYSPSKPRQGDAREAFATIRIPTFHMTGTEDKNPLDANDPPSNRQVPFQSIANADKFLVVFAGGDHMVFSGRTFRGGPGPNYPRIQELVQDSSLAFWDMYLQQKPEARAYLTGGGFAKELGDAGTFEFKVK